MRRRYTLDANSGVLVDRDGVALGAVVSLTIDDAWGGRGGKTASSLTTDDLEETVDKEGGVGETTRPTASQLERAAMGRVWDYYLKAIPSRRRLDSKRERIIRNALRLVGEEGVKQAILGLSRSPFHNGQNEQRKTYLEVRYALKGIGDESDDERIEKAISWAAVYAPGQQQMDEGVVQRLLEDVRYTLSLPHRPERKRGEAAWRRLVAAGFRVIALDKAPFARIER